MARPVRTARLALLAGSFATVLVACSLLNGLDADYKLQTSSDDIVPDATAEARTDAPTVDGGDSSLPSSFCMSVDAGPNGFCWDFEEEPRQGPSTWGWTDSLGISGTVDVTDGIGADSSRALRASLGPQIAGSGQAFLHQELTGAAFTSFKNHELSFSYAITKGTTLFSAALGALGYGTNAGQYVGATIYGVDGGKGTVDVSDPPGKQAGASAAVEIGTWRRVTIAIKRSSDAGPYTSTVTVDAQEVQGPLQIDAGLADAPTHLWIGTFFSSPGDGGVEAVIDNVLVRQWN